MGNIVNILPILYDENSSDKFSILTDFNKREWLTGNNYWFKMFEDLTNTQFNLTHTDTILFILYNGQSEKIISEAEYFKDVKSKLDSGVYKRVIFFQNEVNWDTFERLLDIEDFFYDIFKLDNRFILIRNMFNSRFAFTKVNAGFGFGCFPFQLVHNYNQTEGVNYNLKKQFYLYSANCNVKEERLHFYQFLDKGRYWDKVNTSFFLPLFHMTDKRFNPSEYVSNLGELDLSINYIPKKLKYDTELNVKNLALQDSLESLFQVIFETRYHSHCGIVLSEKLFKGFLYKTPFIVFGQHGILRTLKEFGFKTFDWLIDESYDYEYDNKKRLNMIFKEVEKLLTTPFEELEQKIKEKESDLEWNRKRVMEFANYQIYKLVNLFDV